MQILLAAVPLILKALFGASAAAIAAKALWPNSRLMKSHSEAELALRRANNALKKAKSLAGNH
jgi:hypothetical protein